MQFLIDFNLKRKNQILNLRRMKETFPFARLSSSGKTFRSNKQAKNIAVDNFPRSSGSVLPARSHRKSFIFPISSCESDEHISFQIFAIYFDSNLLVSTKISPPLYFTNFFFFLQLALSTHIYSIPFTILDPRYIHNFIPFIRISFALFIHPKITLYNNLHTGCKIRIL